VAVTRMLFFMTQIYHGEFRKPRVAL